MPKIPNWPVAEKSEVPDILAAPTRKAKKIWKHDNSTTFVFIFDQRMHGLGKRGRTSITDEPRYTATVMTHRNGRNKSAVLTENDNLERVKGIARAYMRENPDASMPR